MLECMYNTGYDGNINNCKNNGGFANIISDSSKYNVFTSNDMKFELKFCILINIIEFENDGIFVYNKRMKLIKNIEN